MSLRNTKVVAAFAGAALLVGGLAACSTERASDTPEGDGTAAAEGGLIGIAMPTKRLERWNQ